MTTAEDEMLAELREIKKLLTPAPAAPAPPAPKGFANEFKAFLSKYGVLGLAVAFILGVYLGALVKALVGDLILPVIGLVDPSSNLTTLAVIFRGQTFAVGDFLNNVITFIIVALVIFIIVKIADRAKIK
ncbi:MAG: MscL family protein [Thaumarchaeota archaeon]|nr:MscL family protein [Nitrososphaerota archaeon]